LALLPKYPNINQDLELFMKLATLLTGIVMTGSIAVAHVPANTFSPTIGVVASAAEPTIQEKIATITKNKGNIGSGDQLRRWFFQDLQPIGIQPGGSGMVVNLYSKKHNFTFSYCTDYDVVVGVRKGKVTKFPAEEVK
jgi:hypothetical protein